MATPTPPPRSWFTIWRWKWVMIYVLLLIAYPLSMGPVAWVIERRNLPEKLAAPAFVGFYSPIYISAYVLGMNDAVVTYCEWWRSLAVSDPS